MCVIHFFAGCYRCQLRWSKKLWAVIFYVREFSRKRDFSFNMPTTDCKCQWNPCEFSPRSHLCGESKSGGDNWRHTCAVAKRLTGCIVCLRSPSATALHHLFNHILRCCVWLPHNIIVTCRCLISLLRTASQSTSVDSATKIIQRS